MNAKQSDDLLRGIGISCGKTSGRLKFFRRQKAATPRPATMGSAEQELARLKSALREAGEQIELLRSRALSSVGAKEAQIFEIHAMLLEDEDFTETLEREIADGSCAEAAVEAAVRKYSALLKKINDPYLSARSNDILDISEQLLRILSGEKTGKQDKSNDGEDQPFILVADDLTPSETVLLDKSRILGFVTFGGTPNSHTSILARAMGIPALVGVGEIDERYDGAFALLDAAKGTLTISPTREQTEEFDRLQSRENAIAEEHERYLRSLINKPAVTRSGHKIMIYANVGDDREVEPAVLNGADGIGLLRSEFLYLSLDRYPTEEELFDAYRSVVDKMQGKRIIIRTLDIGADKQISYFDLPSEENPALGFRAVRICLAREGLFKTQLRAILRASALGTISVMIPMIVSVDEVRRCRALLEECKAELRREGVSFDAGIEFGIMVETPAAAIMSRELAAEVDFFSVGTNDLTQYTLAADRQNPMLAGLAEKNREPVLRLIQASAEAIHAAGGWIGICGELAADLRLTQRFADMEIDELSVSVPYLLGLREKVTECK